MSETGGRIEKVAMVMCSTWCRSRKGKVIFDSAIKRVIGPCVVCRVTRSHSIVSSRKSESTRVFNAMHAVELPVR